nr:uncharacterized protein LOC129388268 [Dermacentor andersoni]
MSSVEQKSYMGFCNALPPTVLTSTIPRCEGLLCANGDFTSKANNYLGDDVSGYGVLSNASKVVAMSEYNDSVAFKFKTGLRQQGIRERTAWLFYNVDLLDFDNKCPEPTYTVLRLFCLELKGPSDQRCQ